MKKLLTLALAVVMIASAFVFPTTAYVSYYSAAQNTSSIKDGDLIYYEDFELANMAFDANAADNVTGNKAITDALGWKIVNAADGALKDHTAQFSIVDGRLLTKNEGGNDSYCYILDDAAMWEIVSYGKYTIQYDLQYVEDYTESKERYVALIHSWDGGDSYYSLHIRTRGSANSQNRYESAWTSFEDGAYEGALRANWTDADETKPSVINHLTGGQTLYEAKVMGLKDRNFSVRIQCDASDYGQICWVKNNDIPNSNWVMIANAGPGSTSELYWYNEALMTNFALGLKTSPNVDAYIDNVYVYAGLGDTPTDKVTNYTPMPMPDASTIRNATSKEKGGIVYIGAQNKVADGKMDVRLVGGVESKKYNFVGFDLAVNGAENVPAKLESNGCYSRLYGTEAGAEAVSYTNDSARYLYTETITGLPATGTVTIELTPYSIDFDGQKTVADTIVVTYTDGVLVSQTYKS